VSTQPPHPAHLPGRRPPSAEGVHASDLALVERLNAGQTAAFDELYNRYADYTGRLALRYTGNHDDSLDVIQDVWMYVAGKFPGFVLTAKFTTFLFPVIRHEAIARRDKRRRAMGVPLDASTDVDTDRAVGGAETFVNAPDHGDAPLAGLHAMIARLPEHQREVILLRFGDDMSLEEISAALAIPLGTVKSRMHLAIKALGQPGAIPARD